MLAALDMIIFLAKTFRLAAESASKEMKDAAGTAQNMPAGSTEKWTISKEGSEPSGVLVCTTSGGLALDVTD